MASSWHDIKGGICNNRHILKNMTWLASLQFANYLIPLLLIPYVVRIVGVEAFGNISYAQNIIAYLTVLVNFGFDYSATQEIAIHRDNKAKTNAIFWSVIRSKALLLLLSFAILFACFAFIDEFNANKKLYLFTALINVGFALFPSWFLQGVENMAKTTVFNFVAKLVGAILIVLLITSPKHYPYYLLILSLSYIAGGGLAFLYVVRKYKLSYTSQSDKAALSKGFPIFINILFATIYSAVGLTMLKEFVTSYELGVYSGAYRLIMAVLMIVSYPINIALFPTISRRFSQSFVSGWSFYRKAFRIVLFFGTLCSVGIFVFADIIVEIVLGSKFEASAEVLRILSLLPLLVLSASMLTTQGMYGLQLQRYAPYIGATICILSIACNYLLINAMGIQGAAWAYIVAELLEITLVGTLIFFHYKKQQR